MICSAFSAELLLLSHDSIPVSNAYFSQPCQFLIPLSVSLRNMLQNLDGLQMLFYVDNNVNLVTNQIINSYLCHSINMIVENKFC